MGWTYMYKPSSQSASEFLREQFDEDGDLFRWETLDISVVKFRTAYAAIRKTVKQTGDSHVFGVVCLLDYRPHDTYNFGWKEVEESMGPTESECPARILDLLTPTDEKYAIEWRKRCRERIERLDKERQFMASLTPGDILHHEAGLSFTSGARLNTFTLLSKKPLMLGDENGYGRYKVPRQTVMQMTKTGHMDFDRSRNLRQNTA